MALRKSTRGGDHKSLAFREAMSVAISPWVPGDVALGSASPFLFFKNSMFCIKILLMKTRKT